MMIDDRNRPPMFDDQMWSPPTIGLATTGIALPMTYGFGKTINPPGPAMVAPPRLHPDDLARRVAELLRGAP